MLVATDSPTGAPIFFDVLCFHIFIYLILKGGLPFSISWFRQKYQLQSMIFRRAVSLSNYKALITITAIIRGFISCLSRCTIIAMLTSRALVLPLPVVAPREFSN